MIKILLGAFCIGLAPIFVRLVSMEPTPIGFYRCGIAGLILLGLSMADGFAPAKWSARAWRLLFTAGFLFALDLYVWHRSVVYVGAGVSTILANTQVFYVAIIGYFFYKEKLYISFVAAVFLAFAGIYLLISSRPAVESDHHALGLGLGLITGPIYTGYLLSLRKFERAGTGISTKHSLVVISLSAAMFLGLAALTESSLRFPQASEWVWLPSLAIVSQVCGWLLITRGLAESTFSRAGLILTLQPVVAVLAGAFVLGERLNPSQSLGALLTILAIVVGTSARQPAKSAA
jgi:drug/metabolite transporter (DMT)-like permease